MSITLPPLPETNFFTADLRSEGIIRSNVYTAIAMHAYATAAIEADRASRVPMTMEQIAELHETIAIQRVGMCAAIRLMRHLSTPAGLCDATEREILMRRVDVAIDRANSEPAPITGAKP